MALYNKTLLFLFASALLFAGFADWTSAESSSVGAPASVAPPSSAESIATDTDAPTPPSSTENIATDTDSPAPSPSTENIVTDTEAPAPPSSAEDIVTDTDSPAATPSTESIATDTDTDTPAPPAAEFAAPAYLPPPAAPERPVREPRTLIVPSPGMRSIGAAMAAARPGDTVKVKNGRYRERIQITPGVTLMAENLFKAVLDGRGRNTVVTMGNSSVIDGFEIRRGTIGVFSTSAQATIRRCRIAHNIQSGVMAVGTLPKMEDNFIVYNRGSGIQGWDVRSTSGSINHNTIAYNSNHGISLGGNTAVTVENNIIAFNDQFGVKPGEETVRVELINNNLYLNARTSSHLPTDNISSDPMFVDAKRFDFNLINGSASIGMGTDNQNLGARILH